MDFPTFLPLARHGVNAVFVVTFRVTRAVVVVRMYSIATALDVAQQSFSKLVQELGFYGPSSLTVTSSLSPTVGKD